MASPTSPPEVMRAWRYTYAGAGLDKSIKLESDAPSPIVKKPLGKDEVLVKICAMSLNPIDYKLPEMGRLSNLAVTTPASPGLDYSGRVVTLGAEIANKFTIGQAVFGRIVPGSGFGTLAEYAVVHGIEGIAAIPSGSNTSMENAASIGTAGLTAYQSITPYVKSGDRIFLNGGSGGVGSFGIQIAKALGLHVTTSCSTKNIEFCKQLGADVVLDYSTISVSEELVKMASSEGGKFKLAVDNVGSQPPELYKAGDNYLTTDGDFVQVGGGLSFVDAKVILKRMLLPRLLGGGKSKFHVIGAQNSHEGLTKIMEWIQEGKVKPIIDSVYAFEDAPKAIEKLKSGRAKGNIVVKISD